MASGSMPPTPGEKKMPDYGSMSTADLQENHARINRSVGCPRDIMIRELESHFLNQQTKEAAAQAHEIKRILRERPIQMLETKEVAPSRVSFFSLPGEVRNKIYNLALFDRPRETSREAVFSLDDHADSGDWEFEMKGDAIRPTYSRLSREYRPIDQLNQARTLSALGVLSGLNMQTRKEIQTYFWANINVELIIPSPCWEKLTYFLERIGPHGRTGLRSLTIFLPYPTRYHGNGTKAEACKCLDLLSKCTNLEALKMSLLLWDIFDNSETDRKAVAAFLAGRGPLKAEVVDKLVDTLHAIPKLKLVRLHMGGEHPAQMIGRRLWWQRRGTDEFYTAAFMGTRADRLIRGISDLLRVRQDVKFELKGEMAGFRTEWSN